MVGTPSTSSRVTVASTLRRCGGVSALPSNSASAIAKHEE